MTEKFKKISKKDAVIGIIVLFSVLAAAVMLRAAPGCSFGRTELINVREPEGRVKYLADFGWEIDPASEEERLVLLPRELDGVMEQYAAMQTEQGYDFASYAGLEVMQYTYEVMNYDAENTDVYAVLYIKGSRVIGADIHSAALDGFMHGIK